MDKLTSEEDGSHNMPMFGAKPVKTIPVDVVGGTTFSRYDYIGVEQTVNMTVTGAGTENPALVPFSGYQSILNFERGQARCVFLSTRLNQLIVVYGSFVYVIEDFLGARHIGTLQSTNGPVHISENFNSQIAIEDGTKIYIYDYGNSTFTTPVIDFVPVFIDFQDSYFIATASNGNWYLSDPNNGHLWDPLQHQTLQTKADILQAAVVLNRQLWIIGQKVSEIWYDQGQQLFPYVRENSLAVSFGAFSRETICSGFDMIVWLAKNEQSQPTILVTTGGQPKSISNEGLDYLISSMTDPSDSKAFLFKQDGHVFYQITFNSDNTSIVYDFNTNLWYTVTDQNRNKHIAKQVVLFNDTLYFISYIDSKLYEMSTGITTYEGDEIPRIRVTKNFRQDTNEVFMTNRVGLQMEEGENDEVGKVMLCFSKDAGINFGNIVTQYLNPQGVRRGQITFWRLGRSNSMTLQFRFYSKGRFVVTNGTMDVYS